MKRTLTVLTTLAATLGVLLTGAPAQADHTLQPNVSAVRVSHADRHYISYLAVGDSITYGAGTSDPATMSYPAQAYIRSIGVGATCWSDACAERSFRQAVLPKILALPNRPTTLVFHYGINDMSLGIPADVLIDNVKSVRRDLRNMGFRVILGTIIPSPRTSVFSTNMDANGLNVQQNRLIFNDWVRTQPTYVEYARPLQCDGGFQCPGLSTLGDVHVNDYGAGLMAHILRTWVKADAHRNG